MRKKVQAEEKDRIQNNLRVYRRDIQEYQGITSGNASAASDAASYYFKGRKWRDYRQVKQHKVKQNNYKR